MPEQCPSSATPGQKKPTGNALRRMFALVSEFIAGPLRRHPRPRRPEKSSNAEYHLTLTQVRRVISSARSRRDRTLIRLFFETGVRRSEACGLHVTDLLPAERLVIIRNGKGGKSRVIPVTAALSGELNELGRTSRRGFVFEGRQGNPISARQVNRIVAHTGNQAGVANPNPDRSQVTCHLFRHSFARIWKQRQGSIETLSKILGHASVKTTWDLYGTEGLQDMQVNYRKMMKKLGDHNAGQEETSDVR